MSSWSKAALILEFVLWCSLVLYGPWAIVYMVFHLVFQVPGFPFAPGTAEIFIFEDGLVYQPSPSFGGIPGIIIPIPRNVSTRWLIGLK
ncbi:hypothetical protein ACKVWM_001855 [Pyricularia oryzae]